METEEEKRITYSLRDYQKTTTDRINNIFNRDEFNRFAAVQLPTGGGKSFIAMQQILSFNNPNYNTKSRNQGQKESDGINNARMLYLAPSHEILNQVKLHIVKNILFAIPNLENMTIAEIDSMIRTDFPSINFKGINAEKSENGREFDRIGDNASYNEKINGILRQISTKDIDILVARAFPNLKFKCYAGVKDEATRNDDKENSEIVSNEDFQNAEFIIADEAHRLGADKWGENFFNAIEKNKKVKVLGITATPERTDELGKDMFWVTAKKIYDKNDIEQDKYLAEEVNVVDAQKDGMVNSPETIQPDYTLVESKEYQEVLRKYRFNLEAAKEGKPNSYEKAKFFEEALIKMENLMGFSKPPHEMSEKMFEKELIKVKAEKQAEVITENFSYPKGNPNGKYIAFIPNNTKVKGKSISANDYFKNYIENIRKQFANVKDENGNTVPIKITFVTSNDKVSIEIDPETGDYIPVENGKKVDNAQTISDFENESNETGGIKILIANNLLNEGVHVDGIDGAIMYRKIDSSTTFLQQSGRTISSLNPSVPLSEQPKTKIIDFCGNNFLQTQRGTGRKFSPRYDLSKIREISEWISQNNNILPEINREIPENASREERIALEKEIRYAITLKRLKKIYSIYKDVENLPVENKQYIEQIKEIFNKLNLWEAKIHSRNQKLVPTEEDFTKRSFLEYTSAQGELLSIYDSVVEKTQFLPDKSRVNRLFGILRVLKLHEKDLKNPPLKLPQEISIQDSEGKNTFKTTDLRENPQSLDFEQFLTQYYPEDVVKIILSQIKDPDIMGVTTKRELYKDSDIFDLRKEIAFVKGKFWTSEYDKNHENIDLFEDYSLKDILYVGLIDDVVLEEQRLKQLQDDASNIVKKSKFCTVSKSGGYINADGFIDKDFSFNENSHLYSTLHVGILQKFEECSFVTGEKYINGYSRDGYDINGYDITGYDRMGFNRSHINRETRTKYDRRGFYYDEDQGKYINRETKTEYDLLGYNIQGFDKDGFERPIGMKDDYYAMPYWHKKNPDGTYDVHRYIKRLPDEENGIELSDCSDCHGFKGDSRSNSKLRNYESTKPTNEQGFLSNGASRKATNAKPYGKEDFYINGLDIDGFNQYNFKMVNGRYIHRDTSSEYNLEGQRWNGKRLELDKNIKYSQQFIDLFFDKGFSVDEITKFFGTSKEEITDFLGKGMKLYISTSPKCFPKLDEVLDDKELLKSPKKREKIREFCKLCPSFKQLKVTELQQKLQELFNIEKEIDARRGQNQNIKDLEKSRKETMENITKVQGILEDER